MRGGFVDRRIGKVVDRYVDDPSEVFESMMQSSRHSIRLSYCCLLSKIKTSAKNDKTPCMPLCKPCDVLGGCFFEKTSIVEMGESPSQRSGHQRSLIRLSSKRDEISSIVSHTLCGQESRLSTSLPCSLNPKLQAQY